MYRIAAPLLVCASLIVSGCSQSPGVSPPVGFAAPKHAAAPALDGYRILHSFDGSRFDGASPSGTLARYNGLMYGTAFEGGEKGFGTIFRVQPDGKNTYALHSFNGADDGCTPISGVAFTGKGNKYYGTARGCGAKKGGTLFYGDASNRTFIVVHAFDTATDGGGPDAAPYITNGTIYGTARNGGPNKGGTLYSVDIASGAFTVLHAFGAGEDGSSPASSVIGVGGKLVGTTAAGGKTGDGTVYEFDPATGKETVLHSFNKSDGAQPTTPLLSWGGVLYGVTSYGGRSDFGVLFKMDPTSGAETVLYDFHEDNAERPEGAPLIFKDVLYGTTSKGGLRLKRCGTIWKYTIATQTWEQLHAFNGPPDDGCHPRGGLAYSFADRHDQLFGTTIDGGAKELGTAFAFYI